MSTLRPRLTRTMPKRSRPNLRQNGTAPYARELASESSIAHWGRRYRARLLATDAGIIVAVAVAALFLRNGFSPTVPRHSAGQIAASVLITACWLITLEAFHTRDARVTGSGATEYKRVVNASALTFGLLAIAFLVFQVEGTRAYFLIALPLGVLSLTFARWLWRKWLLRQRTFGHYLTRAIAVGTRDDVDYVARQIGSRSGAAYVIVGVALDDERATPVNSAGRDIPVVSDLAQVSKAAAALDVDAVIVAGQPPGGSTYIRTLGWDLEQTSAELVLASRLTDVAGPRIHFRPVEGLPLIHVEIPHFEGPRHMLKRTLDIVASGLAILILSPVLLGVAVMVKLDSPGPLFFRQLRCGRNGRTFRMVKFRSMVATAEDDLAGLKGRNEASGLLFKIRNDPRVTAIGRVLRKYSIDELPQLWNVLVGDMSLVGPRPPLPSEVECYESHVHRRLYIKPGLTGMWQINGRSTLSWEDSVRLDLYYVENWSLTGDLMIIWRTFKAVIRPVGAY